jgi:hypothetical protein
VIWIAAMTGSLRPMPVRRATSSDDRWNASARDYARTVRISGTQTKEARDAWKRANEALDEVIDELAKEREELNKRAA